MTDLVLLLIITMLLAKCAHRSDLRYENCRNRKRALLFTVLIIILLAGFAGLRTQYNDTGAYRHGYELITESSWEESDKSIGSNPLFNWVNCQLKMHGVPTQDFLMFWAFVTVGCYMLFCSKYASDYPLTVFLLFTTGCYTFVFAGIKQAAAVGIALIAVMLALKRRWLLFIGCVLTAAFIHPYALMFLLVPFLTYKPWTGRTYLLLLLAVLGGLMLRPLLGTVVNITSMLGEEYTVSTFTGEGVSVFRVIVCNVPLMLSLMYRKRLFADSSETENLFMNLALLNGAIMFVGLFGTANYFGRLANYFLIFQCLALPWMLRKIGGKEGRVLTLLMLLGYAAYFYYANAINQPFDQGFARLSLQEYFELAGG